ncbi:SLC13 family permease [Klebsiella quasipneumoniae]|uniref:SLC13 family permease n=1 Tax=Klebsiella quasipneumoniae TaxID=1463165 RepID=UPI000E53995A|nr:SLC13 family permease [Klebsiella quasipneumoniae]MBC4169632.1 SLC13/DASS family transporter [Klebsiella quasipneumoniae]MBX8481552.1 SLC13 family permease [Klebsiella quasipneumoniae subsp. similipneumoniae]MBX9414387.1 SLC13 family permease [Klebsiella quasipneumoniae subsp. similipneumoniae]MBX9419882.1 SLC13 family permease [Klebsiella quasipneumoniae subsp. similipneumoniae]MDG0557465.1 SLC13 family permease [Klebsiella quasipneumoniae]
MSPVAITLSLLLFSIVMFDWEKIPLAATAMIVCITLVVTGVFDVKTAFAGFINQNVILFVAMFVVGGALFETGVTDKIGGIVTRYARSEKQLIVIIMLVCGILSGFLSNTGTAAVLIPVVIGAAIKSGYAQSRLLMPLAFASALGGNLSLIGSPGNLIAQSALEQVGQRFGFFEYAKLGIPMLLCGIIYFLTIGYKLLPAQSVSTAGKSEKSRKVGCPKYKQVIAVLVLVFTVLGMIFENVIGLPIAIIGSISALFLVITRVITEKQAYQSIDSQTIFLFGGTLALAKALETTGAGAIMARSIINLLGQQASPFLLLSAVLIISCVLTNFMSNTATAALLIPIGLSIANSMGADPRAVLMAIVIGCSCAYATPVGTPANMMIFSAGGYRFMDYVRVGLPLIVISVIVSFIFLPILFPFYS